MPPLPFEAGVLRRGSAAWVRETGPCESEVRGGTRGSPTLTPLVRQGVAELDHGFPVLLEQPLVLLDPVGAEGSHELLADVSALTVVNLGHWLRHRRTGPAILGTASDDALDQVGRALEGRELVPREAAQARCECI